jgi:hypothetical protein
MQLDSDNYILCFGNIEERLERLFLHCPLHLPTGTSLLFSPLRTALDFRQLKLLSVNLAFHSPWNSSYYFAGASGQKGMTSSSKHFSQVP